MARKTDAESRDVLAKIEAERTKTCPRCGAAMVVTESGFFVACPRGHGRLHPIGRMAAMFLDLARFLANPGDE
jgi:ribosomal protein S27AE